MDLDVLIFGTGIAGLWTLGRLAAGGFRVAALESDCVGSQQTICSQGIVHGGTKYLFGKAEKASSSPLSAMPQHWRDCINGRGELPLNASMLLSDYHYLWTAGGLFSRVTGAIAGRVLSGDVQRITHDEHCPEALIPALEAGQVFQLDEPVLNVPALLAGFGAMYHAHLLHYNGCPIVHRAADSTRVESVTVEHPVSGEPVSIRARWYVLAAGAGNEHLTRLFLNEAAPPTQRRPLHMVMARGRDLIPTFAHCIGTQPKPIVTITTHPVDRGHVWYLGGELAESGIERDTSQQIQRAMETLQRTLRGLQIERLEWSTVRIDRAEPAQRRGRRPEQECLVCHGNVMAVWPTKLALAPRLASQIVQRVCADVSPTIPHVSDDPQRGLAETQGRWPTPQIAVPPWLESDCQWTSAP